MDLRYNGAWAAGQYYDGDVVVYNGVAYLCVKPTNQPPTPWTGSQTITMPSVRVYKSTVGQSVPSGAWTAISFDAIRWDKGAPVVHWSASNPTRLTCQVAGMYAVMGMVNFPAVAAGASRYAAMNVNGGGNANWMGLGGLGGIPFTASNGPSATFTAIVQLNVGDYIELIVFQDTGSAMNIPWQGPFPYSCDFAMAMIGGMQGPPGPTTQYGTNLPASPTDGQEYVLVDSVTNPTYQWKFRYNAGSTSTYKWEYVGGCPLQQIGVGGAFWGTNEQTSSTSYTTLTTSGPGVTVPRSGEYDVEGVCIAGNVVANNLSGFVFFVTGGATPGWQGGEAVTVPSSNGNGSSISTKRNITMVAGNRVEMRYATSNAANAAFFYNRSIWVTPRRVS